MLTFGDLPALRQPHIAMMHVHAGSMMPSSQLLQHPSRPCHSQLPAHMVRCAVSPVAPAQHSLAGRCRETPAGQQISPARRRGSQVSLFSTLDMAATSSQQAPTQRLTKQDLVDYLGSGCSPPDEWRWVSSDPRVYINKFSQIFTSRNMLACDLWPFGFDRLESVMQLSNRYSF